MTNLYITADQIGQPNHGGGSVTFNESEALKSLGPCEVWGREYIVHSYGGEPWNVDDFVMYTGNRYSYSQDHPLVHFYAGTFSRTIEGLKKRGSRITYTAAAHSIEASRREHEELGIPYDYPHLVDPDLWRRYLQGYLDADVLIVPSTYSERVMRGYGAANRIEVIPHGCELPDAVAPLPATFTVGYLGAIGPDKGVRYLLEAWRKLNYKDALLKIAGANTTHGSMLAMVQHFGGGNVQLCGWQNDLADFYGSLSLYVQPSVSEGFGIEVLEAMAHGRSVLCSDGAGAADCVPGWHKFKARDVDELASKIDEVRQRSPRGCVGHDHPLWRKKAADYTWDKVRERYVDLWRGLLA